MSVYYNEFDHTAALWLQAAMDAGYIAKGVIDTRSIEDVRPDELIGYTQCHFFAGIGGWSIALRLAGWPDDNPVWTGSCPCQPFSTAGNGLGVNDPRHLWPAWFWLIQQCRPDTIFGEQVANAVTKGWLDDVAHDLENEGYAIGSAIIPACSVGAPHKRDRLWFVADCSQQCGDGSNHYAGIGMERKPGDEFRNRGGEVALANTANKCTIGRNNGDARCGLSNTEQHQKSKNRATDAVKIDGLRSGGGFMGNAKGIGSGERLSHPRGGIERSYAGKITEFEQSDHQHVANASEPRLEGYWGHEPEHGSEGRQEPHGHFGEVDLQWINCPDGKARPVKSGLCLLADGIPAKLRKAALHGYGNAIVPQVAAEFIQAIMVNGRSQNDLHN